MGKGRKRVEKNQELTMGGGGKYLEKKENTEKWTKIIYVQAREKKEGKERAEKMQNSNENGAHKLI